MLKDGTAAALLVIKLDRLTRSVAKDPVPPRRGRGRPMNLRKERFVAKYLETGNATVAAKFAGYSARAAKQQGSRLLTNADVQARLAQARQAFDPEKVLKELA